MSVANVLPDGTELIGTPPPVPPPTPATPPPVAGGTGVGVGADGIGVGVGAVGTGVGGTGVGVGATKLRWTLSITDSANAATEGPKPKAIWSARAAPELLGKATAICCVLATANAELNDRFNACFSKLISLKEAVEDCGRLSPLFSRKESARVETVLLGKVTSLWATSEIAAVELLGKPKAFCTKSARLAAEDAGRTSPWWIEVTSPKETEDVAVRGRSCIRELESAKAAAELLRKETALWDVAAKVAVEVTGRNRALISELRSPSVAAEALGKAKSI